MNKYDLSYKRKMQYELTKRVRELASNKQLTVSVKQCDTELNHLTKDSILEVLSYVQPFSCDMLESGMLIYYLPCSLFTIQISIGLNTKKILDIKYVTPKKKAEVEIDYLESWLHDNGNLMYDLIYDNPVVYEPTKLQVIPYGMGMFPADFCIGEKSDSDVDCIPRSTLKNVIWGYWFNYLEMFMKWNIGVFTPTQKSDIMSVINGRDRVLKPQSEYTKELLDILVEYAKDNPNEVSKVLQQLKYFMLAADSDSYINFKLAYDDLSAFKNIAQPTNEF